MKLRINNNAVVQHTETLRKLHKSALPVAIRETLNYAAFDVKKDSMPKSAKGTFTERQKNFFKANSRVEKAKGFNVNSMEATVGFISSGLHNSSTNYAVKDLEQQEEGGSIDGRSFIPNKIARKGNSNKGLLREQARLTNIQKIINAKNITAKYHKLTRKQRFVAAAIKAGKDGYVLSGKVLWKINLLYKNAKGQTKIYKTALYNFKKNRKVKVKQTGFMRSASIQSANKMETEYIRQAEKQIKRLTK